MIRFAVAVAAMGTVIVCCTTAGETPKSNIPVSDWKKLLKEDVLTIKELLRNRNVFPADGRKARGRAMMIAVLANYRTVHDPNNKDWRRMRSHHITVAEDLDKRKYAAVRKLFFEFQTKLPKDDPTKKLTLKDAMHLFASERMGGYGLEAVLYRFLDSTGKFSDEQFQELRKLGQRLTAISILLPKFAPKRDKADGETRKNWLAWANGLHNAAVQLAATAKSKGDVRGALEKIDMNCTKCHEAFR